MKFFIEKKGDGGYNKSTNIPFVERGSIMKKHIINNLNIAFLKERDRYYTRITINGKRKAFYGKTKSEVKKQAEEYLRKVENGYKDPKKINFGEYMEYWLENYKWSYVEQSTYTRLWIVYRCNIKPFLGDKMIGDITTKMIQDIIDEYANPTSPDIPPLARSGLKRIKQQISSCMKKAVEEDIIYENPCEHVLIPVESCVEKQKKEQIALSDRQLEEFRNAALSKYKTTGEYKSREGLILLIILNLGLRVGEALALEYSDFDFEKKTVIVKKTLQSDVMSGKRDMSRRVSKVKKSTKTSSGQRILSLNDTTLFYLDELQKMNERKKIHSPYLCSTEVGTRTSARNLNRSLNRIIGWTNITENVSLHTLRHSFGSTMLRKGIPIEVVSKLMGHATVKVTYDHYIHVLQEQQAVAMQKVSVC